MNSLFPFIDKVEIPEHAVLLPGFFIVILIDTSPQRISKTNTRKSR